MNQIQIPISEPSQLERMLREFSEFGSASLVEHRNGVNYYINEFWTSRQRQAHRIHEVSYRACFKPQLPAFFIKRLSKEGDIVFDPFMGRGATPIEAAILGRVPLACDVNPLSKILAEPRINAPYFEEVEVRVNQIPWDSFRGYKHEELLEFYHPRSLAQIEGLKTYLLEKIEQGSFDNIDTWIRMIAINRLTGHSTGFFSVYTLPPNQAVSVERQKKINEKRAQPPPQ